ncbi:hypothetical protein GCM10009001_01590 [Virgibacillus siamensis]|uniref:Glutaredoxin family protein n=1 Tax=Virgibacillus siamensis TaxID=480071 RepID=A0ABP3QG42_9BACI
MRKLVFYTKENCPLCDNAKALLDLLHNEYSFDMEERDIYTNDVWLEKYQLAIPVVKINGIMLDCEQISYDSLEKALKETK